MVWLERVMQKWTYSPKFEPPDSLLLREASGLFLARFRFAEETAASVGQPGDDVPDAELVDAVLDGGALSWPVPADARGRLADDADACAAAMRGWLLADVAVAAPPATITRVSRAGINPS